MPSPTLLLLLGHSMRGDHRSWETSGEEKHVVCCKRLGK